MNALTKYDDESNKNKNIEDIKDSHKKCWYICSIS